MAEKQIIWTTEKIEDAKDRINNGFGLIGKSNPFFDGVVGLRKTGLSFRMTEEETDEYIKCATDVHYFAENYCWVKGEDGSPTIIKLRDYQQDILSDFSKFRFNILMASRQSGKTICSAIMMLHFMMFNNNKNVLVTANIHATAVSVLDSIKEIYQHLPFFLQQGIINWAQAVMVFQNKSKIKGFATTKTSSIGQTADFLYLDEFAYLPDTIAEKFYKSVFPTVSNIENSKIIITSTPNGFNLFHKLLTEAEKPKGEKSSYNPRRVYWWQIPKRHCTYIRFDDEKLEKHNITMEDVLAYIQSEFPKNTHFLKYNDEYNYWECRTFNTQDCTKEDIVSCSIETESGPVKLLSLGMITTWKEETIKDIGGEEAFNQEYDLRFVNQSRSLLDETLIEELRTTQKTFEFQHIDEIEDKLRMNYDDLVWNPDPDIYDHTLRKTYRVLVSVDIAEGLGQDYSVINIFKLIPKTKVIIDKKNQNYKGIQDFYRLVQIGKYRNNTISVKDLATLLYLLVYEHFDEDRTKVVVELNQYGGELIAHLPNVFDGDNQYGSSIIVRYKHRVDSEEMKPGLKVGPNKKLLVKDYQDRMADRSLYVWDTDTVNEMMTFIKHTTNTGNIVYRADGSANDDCVMTLVNLCSVFSNTQFIHLVEEEHDQLQDTIMKNHIDNLMGNIIQDNIQMDYSNLSDIRKKVLSEKNIMNMDRYPYSNSLYGGR